MLQAIHDQNKASVENKYRRKGWSFPKNFLASPVSKYYLIVRGKNLRGDALQNLIRRMMGAQFSCVSAPLRSQLQPLWLNRYKAVYQTRQKERTVFGISFIQKLSREHNLLAAKTMRFESVSVLGGVRRGRFVRGYVLSSHCFFF